MGAHLAWVPDDPPPPIGGSLGTAMKYALAERFTEGDTTAVQDGGLTLDESAVSWLEGVRVGRKEGDDLYDDATALLHGIAQHKRVRLVRT